jgi:hypothetical protein
VLLKIASRGNLIDLIEKSSGHGISESDVGWIGAIYLEWDIKSSEEFLEVLLLHKSRGMNDGCFALDSFIYDGIRWGIFTYWIIKMANMFLIHLLWFDAVDKQRIGSSLNL